MYGLRLFEELASAPRRMLGRAFGVERTTTPSGWLALPAFGALGLVSLLPIPSVDGEVIWRELRRGLT